MEFSNIYSFDSFLKEYTTECYEPYMMKFSKVWKKDRASLVEAIILWIFPILLILFAEGLFLIYNNVDPIWASFILCLLIYFLESRYFKLDFKFVINDNDSRIKKFGTILFEKNNYVLSDTQNEIVWLLKKCMDSINQQVTFLKFYEKAKGFLTVIVFPIIVLLVDRFKGAELILVILYIFFCCFVFSAFGGILTDSYKTFNKNNRVLMHMKNDLEYLQYHPQIIQLYEKNFNEE